MAHALQTIHTIFDIVSGNFTVPLLVLVVHPPTAAVPASFTRWRCNTVGGRQSRCPVLPPSAVEALGVGF